MNAKEAKQKALTVNTASENSQYAKIMEKIKQNSDLGLYQTILYDKTIRDDVKHKLIEEGYKVEIVSPISRGATRFETVKISWL